MAKDPICGMDVQPNSCLRLIKDSKTYYFCSPHCLKEFARQNQVSEKELSACLAAPKSKFYRNKVFLAAAILIFLCGLSYIVPFLVPFRQTLWLYFRRIWWAMLLGLGLGGIIDYYIPREYISHILAQPKKKTIFYAVILGFFMSACSHGILALSIELHKKGASNPAVVAFLLASPWANLSITILLLGFFGLKALFIISAALIIAVISGLIFQFLQTKGWIENNSNVVETAKEFSIIQDLKTRIHSYKPSRARLLKDIKGVFSGSISLANMVLWWVLLGMGLASLAGAYIPQKIFQSYMGPTVLGLLVTLIVATILEVCSEGTSPMAFEIYRQTQAFGNALVFLMAGVVTDITEIGLLWHNVGRKVAIWLPIVSVPQVVAWGILANWIW